MLSFLNESQYRECTGFLKKGGGGKKPENIAQISLDA